MQRDAAKFAVSAAVCARLGWGYRLVGALDPITAANVRWLAGNRNDLAHVVRLLREIFAAVRRSAGQQSATTEIAY